MSNTYRVVKLLKNHLYPTYQLHAFMANDKISPQDGLRLAALTTMHWLKMRLGDDAPDAWRSLADPEEFLHVSDEDLPSLYVNQGHVINIVSLPEKGMWTLQITEPDLGSDPGNPEQSRSAVPGRIIETNIAFLIVNKKLECGFKTVISDPVGTEPEAEVYRIAVVRELMKNPSFGLKQVTEIPMSFTRLTNASQVKTMLYVTHHAENALPTVIFTQTIAEKKTQPLMADYNRIRLENAFSVSVLDKMGKTLPKGLPNPVGPERSETVVSEPPYDLNRFAYYTFSHCRTYVLEMAAFKNFSAQSGINFKPGDAIVLYHRNFKVVLYLLENLVEI